MRTDCDLVGMALGFIAAALLGFPSAWGWDQAHKTALEALIPVSHGKCHGCLLCFVYQPSVSETENNRTFLSTTHFLFS